jgi:hypothetical protein
VCDEYSQEELTSCEKEPENIQNTFLLKTNLSESEIEKLLLQEFSSMSNNKRKNPRIKEINEDDVKHFKSKDNLNKTISFLEIKNVSEFQNENNNENEKIHYQLIDVKETDETKIFLSFDKFFKSQYKEMFEYSYTIVIFFFALIGMIIYYTCFLPTEANELNRTSRNNKPILDNISNDDNIQNENDADVDYILKE